MSPVFRRRLFTVLAVFAALGVLGAAVALSGVIPLKASAGHWAVTRWFLELGKRRSVSTHTLGLSVGELSSDELVLRGAGHYEGGCRPCHGSPASGIPRIAAAMLPTPPKLAERVPTWDDDELFYLVKHGIKLTGMPAWPAQHRDDEVRAVVAFMKRLPALDAAGYRALVFGDEAEPGADDPPLTALEPGRPPDAAQSCARCHGARGEGRGNGAFPKLAGQRREYLLASLDAYAAGRRHSGLMEPIAFGLTREDREELSAWYAGLGGFGAGSEAAAPADAAAAVPANAVAAAAQPASEAEDGAAPPRTSLQRGRDIAHRGVPELGVPACVECHGPSQHAHNAHYPKLAGQYESYLSLQLELFAQEHRGGTPYAHLMEHVAPRLTPEQRRDVAAWYASLGAEER